MAYHSVRHGLVIAAAVLTLAACAGFRGSGPGASVARADTKRETSPAVEQTGLSQLVDGNTMFALDLYQAISSEADGNLMLSPYSVSLALAMTYAGARGDTEQQMQDTLHFLLPQEDLHPAFNALDLDLTGREYNAPKEQEGQHFQMNIANAIWGQEGYSFLPDFLDVIARNYGAGLRLLDFAQEPEKSRITINDWVSDETEERIQDLIPQGLITPDTCLVLTNAIYFNASWLHPFEESATRDDAFFLLDGGQVTVPMMSQQESLGYTRGETYQAVELPYLGEDMAMLVMLPDEGRFEDFEGALDAAAFTSIRDSIQSATVDLTMPRFKYEYDLDLAKELAEMGMPAAFGGGADFSGISGSRDLFISNVIHKTFVQVDESGTEAAAATAVIMRKSAAIVEGGPVEVRVDRPFIFAIYDKRTGTTLFIGRVLNPAE